VKEKREEEEEEEEEEGGRSIDGKRKGNTETPLPLQKNPSRPKIALSVSGLLFKWNPSCSLVTIYRLFTTTYFIHF